MDAPVEVADAAAGGNLISVPIAVAKPVGLMATPVKVEPGTPILALGSGPPKSSPSPQKSPFPGMNLNGNTPPQNGPNGPRNSHPNSARGGRGNQGNNRGRGGHSQNNSNPRQINGPGSAVPEREEGQGGQNKDREPEEAKKFTNRARLFVGNLSNDTTENDIRGLFSKYTPDPDVFVDKQKMFAFVKMDTRTNAELAKSAIDGTTFKNRVLRVRYATHNAGLRIKNLSQNVSNELLMRAFEKFGEIESAVVAVDERGRACGEGIVCFARKNVCMLAMRQINEGVFLLGTSPRPVHVELLDQKDLDDGLPEIHVANRSTYQQETAEPPHFARAGSVEHEFGMRWKKLYENHQKKMEELDKLFKDAAQTLEKEMEGSVYDREMQKIKDNIMAEQRRLQEIEAQKTRHMTQAAGAPGPQNILLQHQQSFNQQMNSGVGRVPLPPPGFGGPVPAIPALGSGGGQSPQAGQQQNMDQHRPLLPQQAQMLARSLSGSGPVQGLMPPSQFAPGGPAGYLPGPSHYLTAHGAQQERFEQFGQRGPHISRGFDQDLKRLSEGYGGGMPKRRPM